MKRRDFITLLGGAAATWSLAASAQQVDVIARIGVLGPSLDVPTQQIAWPHFIAELRKLSFVEKRNLVIDLRLVDQEMAKAFTHANELAAAKVNVLFAQGAELALRVALAVRPPLPIVMLAYNYDPVARGYVASLARPGGNITGIFSLQPELAAKQLEALAEAFPGRRRVGVLWDEQSADQFRAAERAARSQGLLLHSFKFEHPPYDYSMAFRALVQEGVEMLLVISSPLFYRHNPGNEAPNAQIAKLAIAYRLPTMFILRHYVDAGGLMSYGADYAPLMRRAAWFVAKVHLRFAARRS